jgi:hypothetical protein
MTIILLFWWSLARGNRVVPSRWQATSRLDRPRRTEETGSAAGRSIPRVSQTLERCSRLLTAVTPNGRPLRENDRRRRDSYSRCAQNWGFGYDNNTV